MKFQGTNIFRSNNVLAGVLSKMARFAKMSVRYANIFASLMKTGALFQNPGVW